MHDLRAQVYRHLQRLSLAFFTRTRTGEIQSRIANDIGGVQTVVTTTATSIVSNVTTVIASVVAMFLLDWRLALFSLGAAAVLRAAGAPRRRPAAQGSPRPSRARWPTSPRSCRSRCRSPGILLGKTMGRGAELADRFEGESARPGRPRGPLADGRPLDDGLDPDLVRGHARARLPVRRAWPRARSRSARSSPSRRCRRGCSSRSSRCSSVAVDIQTSTALFDRVFEYLDLPVDIAAGHARAARVARRGALRRTSGSATTRSWTLRDIDLDVPRRHAHGAGRRDRLGQDDARLPRRAAVRPRAGRGADRRRPTCAS